MRRGSSMAGLIALLVASPAVSQAVADSPACDDCEVRFSRLTALGAQDDDGIVSSIAVGVAALGDSLFGVFEPSVPGRLKLHRRGDGSYLRTLGSSGQGPGEYTGIHRVLQHADGSVTLIDSGNGRLNSLDDELRFVDSTPFRVRPFRSALARDSVLFVNAMTPGSAPEGHLLHLVGLDGEIRISFGGDGSPLDLRPGRHVLQRVIAANDSLLVAAPQNEYRLDLYDYSGALVRSISREAKWFEPHDDTGARIRLPAPPPNPKIRELAWDSEGRLWVVSWVPDPEWPESVREASELYGPNRNDHYDTVVEVLDLAEMKVIARGRYDRALQGHVSGASLTFHEVVQLPTGFLEVGIVRAELHELN